MKHTLLFLLLLVSGMAGAQTIAIPDANFKAQLLSADISNNIAKDNDGNSMVIDVNGDGEIQQDEAQGVYELYVANYAIASLQGIEAFTNITYLDCSFNTLTSLNVSTLLDLEVLICSDNNLTALQISDLPNLEALYCNNNNLSSLAISSLVNLRDLECGFNQLTALDVAQFDELRSLNCESNLLANLTLGGLDHLEFLICKNNNLAAIDVTGLDSLEGFDCSLNQLTELDLSELNSLHGLVCNSNQLTEINFSGLEYLSMVYCANNQLTTLDFSDNPELIRLSCSSNNLTMINLKNGAIQDPVTDLENEWYNNPNLQYVCTDEAETAIINDILSQNGYTDISVNTYCSFMPGGAYNTITGTLTFDDENNGCDSGDAVNTFVKVTVTNGTETSAVFTNGAGNYNIYTGAGNFNIAPQFEDNYFTATPAIATYTFPTADGLVEIADFCITPSGIHNDVEVVMVPIVPARPGFNALYKIVYRNKGNQPISGSVSCQWDYNYFGNVALSPMADELNPGNYTWYYSDLLPFENREILMMLEVNSPADTPAVNAGDILPFTAMATQAVTDDVPEDNNFIFNQEVVGSFDPNNILCVEGATAPPDVIGEYLHYVINFENSGNAEATFVVAKLEVDTAKFDISTLEVLNSSHEMSAIVTGNTVEFKFNNINLAAADHGNILFKLKSRSSLVAGDNVMNQANIFFDYNLPVQTNQAVTVFDALGVDDVVNDTSLVVYPNPATGLVTISADTQIKSFNLYDIQGRLLQSVVTNGLPAVLDVSGRAKGVYILRVTTETGTTTQKLLKN